MNQKTFTLKILIFFCLYWAPTASFSNDCPVDACVVDLPPDLPADTIYLGSLPNGEVGIFYDNDVSFRMPKTTTPVNEIDPSIPPGWDITQIDLIGLSNLPPGITWEANQTSYDPQVETDGCLRFFGTPLVAGTYLIEVNVEATVFITQEATFFIELIIDPSSSITEGFTMLNNTGCGEVVVSFQNNIPSNGDPGFSYQWNFGNGNSSLDENPSDQLYSDPGIYVVNYEATIDTVGYVLTRAVITGTTCDDFPTAPDWSDNPDIHIEIRDPNGNLVYTSETVWNTDPPIEYFPNLNLMMEGNYELKAIDSDSGINGADDICGTVPFNQLSNGPILTGNFNLHLDIIHPVEVVTSSDTVWVFDVPDAPVITDIGATSFCEGETAVLYSSYDEGNQWLLDGNEVIDAFDSEFEAFETGAYSVVYTDSNGCSAVSEELFLEFYELPEEPEYNNVNNLLSLVETISYPSNYTFQWYQNNEILAGETEMFYCAMEDGDYSLEVTDPETGCVNVFTASFVYDAELECFVSTNNLAENWNLKVFPNPVLDVLNISLEMETTEDLQFSVFDLYGRQQYFDVLDNAGYSNLNIELLLDNLTPGMYLLEIKSGVDRVTHKFVKK